MTDFREMAAKVEAGKINSRELAKWLFDAAATTDSIIGQLEKATVLLSEAREQNELMKARIDRLSNQRRRIR